MQWDARFKCSIDAIKVTYAMLNQFTQRIAQISLYSCLKDGSTEVCILSVSLSISLDGAVQSLQHAKSEQAHSLQGVLSEEINQTSSQ